MTKQKTPHTQSQQNANPAQRDLEPDQQQQDAGRQADPDADIYRNMEGSESGGTRSAKKTPDLPAQRTTEPPTEAYEGSVSTRTPRKPAQGITSHSAEEESARQEKVVNERPDAQAGLNHSK